MPKGTPNPPLNFDCLKPRIPLAVIDAIKALTKKWREPHEDCKEGEHVFDCFCSVYDDCADELENEIHRLAELYR